MSGTEPRPGEWRVCPVCGRTAIISPGSGAILVHLAGDKPCLGTGRKPVSTADLDRRDHG